MPNEESEKSTIGISAIVRRELDLAYHRWAEGQVRASLSAQKQVFNDKVICEGIKVLEKENV